MNQKIDFDLEQVWTQPVGDNQITVYFDSAVNVDNDFIVLTLEDSPVITITGSDVAPFFKWMLETRLDELKAAA
jgi:hypothetical protein